MGKRIRARSSTARPASAGRGTPQADCRLLALAVAAPRRYPSLPDVPTAAQAGLPEYNVDFWDALIGPGAMAAPLVDRSKRDVAAIVAAPQMKESLRAQGVIEVGGRPQELDALIAREYEQWVKVVK